MLSYKHYSTAALLAAFTAMSAVPRLHATDLTVDSSTSTTVSVATGDTVTVGAADADVVIEDSAITPLVQVGTLGGPTAATDITIDQDGSVTFSSSATTGDVLLYDATINGNTNFAVDIADGKTITYTANGTDGTATVVAAGDAGVVLTLGDGSSIFVNATSGKAYAIVSAENVDSSATGVTGTISAIGKAEAKAIDAAGTVNTGDVSGVIKAEAEDAAAAIEADGAITVGALADGAEISATAQTTAQAIAGGAAITVGDIADNAVIKAIANGEAAGDAYAIINSSAAKITVGAVAGDITAQGVDNAKAISSDGEVEVGDVSGNITAAAKNATAIQAVDALQIGNVTGQIAANGVDSAIAVTGANVVTVGDIEADAAISATATGETSVASAIEASTAQKLTVGKVDGTIAASAGHQVAAISGEGDVEVGITNNISGVIQAVATADNGEAEAIYGAGVIDLGNLTDSAKITASGAAFAKAISGKDAITVGGIAEDADIIAISTGDNGAAAAIVTDGAAKITVGDVAGDISAMGGNAVGISGGGEVEIGAVSGNITAIASAEDALAKAVYANDVLTLGDVSGNIIASGDKAIAISGDDAVTTGEISGTISATGEDFANAIYSQGALSTTISGTVSATVTDENGVAAAISTVEYKDLGGGTMGWDTANSGVNNDSVILSQGANVIGDIRLGQGADTVTFNGSGSYDYSMFDVENVAVNATAVTIAEFATMTEEEKSAAILGAVSEDNTWTLSKDAEITQLDVNSGFLKVGGTITASGAANIAAGAGVIFELTDETKIVANDVTLGDDSFIVAKQGEMLVGDKTYEVITSTNAITDNGVEYAIEDYKVADSVLVDYELVAAETDPEKKVQIKATYKGMDSVIDGGGNGLDAANSFEGVAQHADASQEVKDVMTSLQNITSKGELNAAVKKLSPEGSLAVANASVAAASGFSNQMASRSGSVGVTSFASADSNDAYPLMFSGPSFRDENGYEAWTSAYGQKTDQDDNDGVAGFESDIFGTVVGIDRMNDNFLAGVALGYATADIDTNNNLGSTDLDALSLGAYFAYAPSEIKFEGGVVYTYGQADFSRNTLSGTAEADDVSSYAFTPYFGASYDLISKDGRLTLSPNAKLSYTYFNQDGYKEKGAGGLSLDVDSFHNDIVTGTIGITSAYKLDETITLNGLVALKYDFSNDAAEVDSIFLAPGATPFTSKGLETDKTAIELGAGFDWKISDKLKASCDYTYEHRDSSESETLTVGLNLLF
ncbi:autotransporter outer membrane beta-barrel domain-containing protein [Planctomycetota bacterium]|nr:autotransporter outer membrane beta-barrel domain-containing protein [Planctomycetota bacterium]